MPWLALILGLIIGSFLNVCISRWPVDLSVVQPRSHCPQCKQTLAWYDLIPVASFFLLRRACRHCSAPIATRYPIVEAVTGALFFFLVSWFGPTLLAAKFCVFCSLLIGLLFSDVEHRILPDQFTIGGAALGFAFAFAIPMHGLIYEISGKPDPWGSLLEAAIGGTFPAVLLWTGALLYFKVRKREGLGLGDVKMMIMIGAFLGLQGALLTAVAGSVLGSVLGLVYIKLAGKDSSTYELPFGTFLAVGGIFVVLWAHSEILARGVVN